MSGLIGRFLEKEKLQNALKSKQSELIVVYGRRRVGKTFLIRQVFNKSIKFELTGLHNGSLGDQLENFHLKLSSLGSKRSRPKTWLEAFSQLTEFIENINSGKKNVIFIDEFPWLATRKSKFLMAFENFWNNYASKKDDLIVVICGSAASYMVKKIIRNRGGLHNRITERIRLLPFNLFETKLYLKSKGINYTNYDILRIYMVLGGVPHYLNYLNKGESVPQAIDRLCFTKDVPLKTEFKDIFVSLFENHERHDEIVTALASTRKGLTRSEISKKTGIPTGGRLTTTLNELEESGFIEVYPVFGNIKKNFLYRINDEYSMFYLKFIEKDTSKGRGTWLSKANGQSYISWLGFSFETICLKHVDEIKNELGIASVDSDNYSWTGEFNDKGAQIDLLIDRADNVINLCEMKFYNNSYSIDKKYAGELRNKLSVFKNDTKTKKNVFITMITTYGIKQNEYSLELVQNELTMDCLFKQI